MYFNMQKIKFSKLNSLFENNIDWVDTSTPVNVFIDIESVLRRLTFENVSQKLKVSKGKELSLVSNLINLAAHYRLYFKSKRMKSNIYLYLGYPFDAKFMNKLNNEEYRDNFRTKFKEDHHGQVVGNILKNTIDIARMMVKYIEGVYLITEDYLEPSAIPYAIMKKRKLENHFNILVSSDRYNYQYVRENFVILRPKRNSDYIITKNNVFDMMCYEDKVQPKDTEIPVDYITMILSFLGSQYRNIKKIDNIGLSRVMKLIEKGLEMKLLNKDTVNFNSFQRVINDEYKELILNNFICTDIYTQYAVVESSKVFDISLDEMLVDLFDNDSLRRLNEQFFHDNPLMLIEILPEKERRTKSIFEL